MALYFWGELALGNLRVVSSSRVAAAADGCEIIKVINADGTIDMQSSRIEIATGEDAGQYKFADFADTGQPSGPTTFCEVLP